MKTIRLRELIDFLDGQTRATLKGRGPDVFLAEHQVDLSELLLFTRFREDTYARNLIHRAENYELFALAWLPKQRAAIHDHAGQRCWMTVGIGEVTFQNYAIPASLNQEPAPIGKAQVRRPGDCVYIDDGIGLHSIVNSGRTPAVTMHLYAAPISECLVYCEKRKCFTQVTLQSFPPPYEAVKLLEPPSDLV